jgi:putative tryptophan/tyrosine transport system substrate-binding protein
MKRRELITLLGGAAAASVSWPLPARAQQRERIRLVGLLWGLAADDPESQRRFAAFAGGLRELGWTEGKNVAFELRYAVGNPDRFSAMAADLVQMNASAIVATSAGLVSIARQATGTIPIVAASAGALEGTGLIASLRRPGGNVTGNQILSPELMSKRVELLKQLVPNLTRLGVIDPVTPAAINSPRYLETITEAARALQIQVHHVEVRSPDQFAVAVAAIAREDQAALVIANPLSGSNAKVIAGSAAQNRLPTIYEFRFFALAGGLLSYGPDNVLLHRNAATYVDKILKGANPGDLPVQQPTKFDLVINLNAAKALGLTVPDKLLALADEVIE